MQPVTISCTVGARVEGVVESALHIPM